MIGKFMTERKEISKRKVFVASSSAYDMEDDLQRCLMSRNIDSKREKHKRTGQEMSERRISDGYFITKDPQVATSKELIRNYPRGPSNNKSEILVEGTALSYNNFVQDSDVAEINVSMKSGPQGQNVCTSKDGGKTDARTAQGESSLCELRVCVSSDRRDQENTGEMNLSGSAKEAPRSLNPSPWKEIWSVLQDRSLTSCLSTRNMEFGRDVIETPFSTRTNPYSGPRKNKPQRIPPLYNTRKPFPTSQGNKEKMPSFDDAVVFHTVLKDARRDQGIGSPKDMNCEQRLELKKAKEVNLKKEPVEGNTSGRYENKCEKERTDILPNIAYPAASERYKSKFRVRLLPLVAKSDSLPNLTSSSTSVPSELIVTAPMNVVHPDESVLLGCFKNAERKTNLVSESELVKFRKNRSMSLDSVFSLESFAAYQANKSFSNEINVKGLQVLPDIKQSESNERKPTMKKPREEGLNVTQMLNVISLPWKCT